MTPSGICAGEDKATWYLGAGCSCLLPDRMPVRYRTPRDLDAMHDQNTLAFGGESNANNIFEQSSRKRLGA